MTELDEDQGLLYQQYFQIVQNLNDTNLRLIEVTSNIAVQRKADIQKAMETHINPILSRLRLVQILSVLVGIGALCMTCTTISSVYNSTTAGQTGASLLFGLILAAAGVIAVFVFSWTSKRISTLMRVMKEMSGGD